MFQKQSKERILILNVLPPYQSILENAIHDGVVKCSRKIYYSFGIYTYTTQYGGFHMAPEAEIGTEILHYPQLDTVLMVEEFVKEHSGDFKKRSLWEHLPKKMMYQTFMVVYDYLLNSGKIARDSEHKICWIWNPELVAKYLQNEALTIR